MASSYVPAAPADVGMLGRKRPSHVEQLALVSAGEWNEAVSVETERREQLSSRRQKLLGVESNCVLRTVTCRLLHFVQ